MKQLLGIVILALTGLMPVTAFTQDNNPDTKGTGMVTVSMQTNKGVITLELDSDKAPDTVANFVAYASDGHYDGTIFHRVIPGFMIQGGGFDADMNQKSTNAPVKNEANNGLKNVTGSIAMARTNDPHSASAQFFINVKDNTFLDHTAPTPRGWGYAVFGKVTGGMDVVTSIESVPTGNKSGHQDVPLEAVVIEKVTIE
jgi:peptidyl-prolyl cis-trans isomerase B (cyclophilin B)